MAIQMNVEFTGDEQHAIQELSGCSPVSCSCTRCAAMCKKVPCMGTPQDILALINAGYIYEIRSALNLQGFPGWHIPDPVFFFMPYYDTDKGSCTFLQNDLCILHDKKLKPTEGRLIDCKMEELPEGKVYLPAVVLLTWLRPENLPTIRLIEKAASKYPHLSEPSMFTS